MSATTPVLAIHGVNNRHRRSFEQRVGFFNDRLNQGQGGTRWRLYPVWWGQRGSQDEHVGKTVPNPWAAEARLDAVTDGSAPVIDDSREPAETLEGLRLAVREASEARAESADPSIGAEIEATIERLWPQTLALKHGRADVLSALGGRLVDVAAYAQASGGDVTTELEQVMWEEEASLLDEWAARLNYKLRGGLIKWVSRFFGDIVVYSGDASDPRPPSQPNITSAVDEALATVRDETKDLTWGTSERPISVVAHSLGSLVVFDAIGRDRDALVVNALITFGSQISWFHAIDQRRGWHPFSGSPLPVPKDRIRRWTNIWNAADPLAFIMEPVFRGDSAGPDQRVTDIEGPTTIKDFHGMYWDNETVAAYVQKALIAADD